MVMCSSSTFDRPPISSESMQRTFAAFSRTVGSRPFHTSAARTFPRHPPARAVAQSTTAEIPLALRDAASIEGITPEDFEQASLGIRAQWSVDDIVENENDPSSAGHLYLIQQRQNLHYLRLIEHEMPKLVGEHGPFWRVCIRSDTQSQLFASRSFLRRRKRHSSSGLYLMAVKNTRRP